jgi:hypothetical protein
MADVIIYADGPHNARYRPLSVALQSPPFDERRMLTYTNGVLYALDHKQSAEIAFPASRWKLAEIGLSCILAAITK